MSRNTRFSIAGRARWSLVVLLLLVALARGVGPEAAAAPAFSGEPYHPVISEFRSRGPAGASDEFVEIFNPTGDPFDLTGWSLRKSSGCGFSVTTMLVLPAVTLPPGGFLLLTNAGGYSGAVPGDFTYPGSQSLADNGGLALVDALGAIVDQVGMCPPIVGSPTPAPSGQAFYEGTPLPAFPNLNVDQSYARTASALCLEQNDNSLDFSLTAPSGPQNSTAPAFLCPDAATATPTFTPTETPTPSDTPTPTATLTPSPTASPTSSPTQMAARRLIISEVAWGGTAASSDDEWIELFNPGPDDVNLSGWVLAAADGTPTIALSGVIPAGGYFLLERGDDSTVSDMPADLIFASALSNSGEILHLYAPGGLVIDTANADGGSWPAGSGSPTYASMERVGVVADLTGNWLTNSGVQVNGLDAAGNPIRGTPGRANWAFSVTATPSMTPTPTRTRTPTRTPTPIRGWVVINEFLPRAGSDWNGDGVVDVNDEYIELINVGTEAVDLKGWRLDDDARSGSPAFSLPSVTLPPGQRIVFYASQTGISLSDGGDTVLLLRPGGLTADIYNYPVVRYADEAWCREPEGQGIWTRGCRPSPGRAPGAPAPVPTGTPAPGAAPRAPSSCALPDMLIDPLWLAECPGLADDNLFPSGGVWVPATSRGLVWVE